MPSFHLSWAPHTSQSIGTSECKPIRVLPNLHGNGLEEVRLHLQERHCADALSRSVIIDFDSLVTLPAITDEFVAIFSELIIWISDEIWVKTNSIVPFVVRLLGLAVDLSHFNGTKPAALVSELETSLPYLFDENLLTLEEMLDIAPSSTSNSASSAGKLCWHALFNILLQQKQESDGLAGLLLEQLELSLILILCWLHLGSFSIRRTKWKVICICNLMVEKGK